MGPDWSGLSHVPIHEPITVIGVKHDEWRRLMSFRAYGLGIEKGRKKCWHGSRKDGRWMWGF